MKEDNEKLKQAITEEIARTTTGELELTIREGQASDVWEPRDFNLSGNLDTPYRWLQKRLSTIDPLEATIVVNRENLIIDLYVDERNKGFFNQSITGRLNTDPAHLKFGINSGRYMSTFALADLIKMNRSFFTDPSVAMNLVSGLKNFKASIQKKLESSDNDRGNKSVIFDQVMTSNIPEGFTLNLPIFKGQPKVHLKVEVYINAETYECTLISPEANDLIEEARDKQIDRQLADIRNLSDQIVIIEQ